MISAANSPFGTVARAHTHDLTLHKLTDAVAAQRFHMDEDVRRVRSARHEAIALAAVEPFHRRIERRPFGLGQIAPDALCRRWRHCGRAVVERDQPPRLKTAGALHGLADNLCTFIGRLESGLANACLMQKYISLRTARRFDKSVSFGEVEPFDLTDHFLCRLAGVRRIRFTRFHPRTPNTHGKNKVNTCRRISEANPSKNRRKIQPFVVLAKPLISF